MATRRPIRPISAPSKPIAPSGGSNLGGGAVRQMATPSRASTVGTSKIASPTNRPRVRPQSPLTGLKGPNKQVPLGRKPTLSNNVGKVGTMTGTGTNQNLVGTSQNDNLNEAKKQMQKFVGNTGQVKNPEGLVVSGQGTGVPGGQLVGDNGPSQNPQGIGQGNTGQGTLSEGTVVNESLTGTKKQTPRVAAARRTIRGFKKGGTFKTGSVARKERRQKLVNKSNNDKVFKQLMDEQRQRG